jgi:hypothetical protein
LVMVIVPKDTPPKLGVRLWKWMNLRTNGGYIFP